MAMTNSEKAKLFFERINASEANVSIKRRIEDVLYSEKDGKVAGGVLKKYIENVLLYKKDKAQFETLISSFDREMAKANKGDNDISSMPYDEDEKFVNLYVVKYDLFYALSAAMMYMSALNKIRETKGDLGDELFVSSVGAGNLVDFWSLNYALSLYQIQNPGKKMPEKIVYRAYDYKRWKHYLWELMPEDKGIIFPEDNFFSIRTELYLGEKKGNFKDIDTTLPVDIMLFPNSYNEIVGALGDEAFWSIIREIKNNNDGMVIVASEHIAENSFEDRVKYHFGKNTKVDVIKDDKSKNSILEMADDRYHAVKEYRLLLQGLELPEKPVFMERKGAEAVGGTYQYNPTRNIEKNLNYSLVYLKKE